MENNTKIIKGNIMQTSKKASARQENIRDLLLLKGTISLSDLCETFHCSEATIRNDLAKLEKEGVLKRVLGGAVANEYTPRNSVITKRLNKELDEKNQIAEYVVNHIIKPNMIISLDSGTTNMALAQKILDNKIPCTIVTNSFYVASIISKSPDIQLCLAGGCYDFEHGSFHDDVSDLILKSYRSEICFISPNGVDKDGMVTNSGTEENLIKQQMIKQAVRTILLADNTKLNNTELKIICYAKDVDLLITDSNATAEQITSLTNAGFNIVVAGKNI